MLTLTERAALRDKLFIKLMELKIINISFKNYIYISRRKNLYKALDSNDELRFDYYLYISEFEDEEEALYCIRNHDDYEHHRCPYCNKLVKFYSYSHGNIKSGHQGYRVICGDNKCIAKCTRSEKANKKRENTCEQTYGTKNPMQSKEVQDKAIITNREKYGCDYPTQNPEIQAKAVQTNLAKRGVEYSTQDPEVRKKYEQTCEAKYGPGIKNTFQAEECKAQAEQTKLERYGDSNYNNHEQAKQTCLERYGKTNPKQVDSIIAKAVNTYMQNHSVINPAIVEECQPILDQIKNGLTLIDTYCDDNYFKQFIELFYNYKNRLLRLNEIGSLFDLGGAVIKNRIKELNLLDYFYIQDSSLELHFKDFLIDNNLIEDVDFERHNRSILPLISETCGHPEIDFYLKNDNMGFEINDEAGHNIMRYNSNYHYNKTIQCLQKNIRLIHIWE